MKRYFKLVPTLPMKHQTTSKTFLVRNYLILFLSLKCHLLKPQSPVLEWGLGGTNRPVQGRSPPPLKSTWDLGLFWNGMTPKIFKQVEYEKYWYKIS